ncbi:hypothetical protein M9Y10_024634 [Tritrichomonas musculus]|uniref:Uncharacterized protein n=1 Tax=Tritrichomonas musculus TaxID=1915356 RepID=A0ABR2HAU0_9EUKA
MIFRSQETNTKYHHFFYPEIKEFIEKQEIEKTEKELGNEDMSINFENKRKIGENKKYICELIRNDSIEQFVIYVNQTNLSLFSTKIEPSIFETNSFLMDKKPTLIEYAAFYKNGDITNHYCLQVGIPTLFFIVFQFFLLLLLVISVPMTLIDISEPI